MDTQLSNSNGSGNWIVFLFGAMFTTVANSVESNAINYAGHAIVGGVIFLAFKMLGDFLTPLLLRLGTKFKRWLDEDDQFD